MGKALELSGKKFGMLTVISLEGSDSKHRRLFLCKCDCGKECIKVGTLMVAGKVRSCGCMAQNNFDQTTHGQSKTHLYGVWHTMKSRCNNPNAQHYKNYGAVGIAVCDEWNEDFLAFHDWAISNGYQEGLTIDRIDVNGNYCPENCRWITQKEQCNNKGNNRYIEHNGQVKTLHQLADEYGIKYKTLWMRLNTYHWSLEKALNTKTP